MPSPRIPNFLVLITPVIFEVCLLLIVKQVEALRWQLSYLDGPCPKKPYQRVEIDPAIMDSFKYISAASKLLMYTGVAQLPNYQEIGEDEFFYDICVTHNASTAVSPITSVFGFNERLLTFNVTALPGAYRNVPVDPKLAWLLLEETVTLTDGHSFIFLASCVPKLNLKTWSVNTLGPNTITPKIRRDIENHAVYLGFNKDNFVFLRYDGCRRGIRLPTLEETRRSPTTTTRQPYTYRRTSVVTPPGWSKPRKRLKTTQ